MQHGRWYPTQVLLADGRTVVIDGLDERGEPHVNSQIESYTPDLDFVTMLSVRGQADHPPAGGLYPHMFQMPSGRVLVAGPTPSDSWFFRVSDIGALTWEDAPDPVRHTFGSGVLLPGTPSGSTRVALIGGVDRDALPDTGTSTPLPIVQTFDEANPSAGWTDRASAQLRARAPQHGAAAGPLDGHGGRRLRDPQRQPAGGRPGDPPQHRDLRPGERAVDPRARPGRAADLPLHRAAAARRARAVRRRRRLRRQHERHRGDLRAALPVPRRAARRSSRRRARSSTASPSRSTRRPMRPRRC